jgi:hypothetical protein
LCTTVNVQNPGQFFGAATITVEGCLDSDPGICVSETIDIHQIDPGWPCTYNHDNEDPPGKCTGRMTVDECEWCTFDPMDPINSAARAACCALNSLIEDEAALALEEAGFSEICRTDCSPGNAFEHAFINCVMAKKCGSALAKEFWDLHEQRCEEVVPNCITSAMDLHNNRAGRGAAGTISQQSVQDCTENAYPNLPPFEAQMQCYEDLCINAALESMSQGELIWPSPPPNPPGNCPSCGGTNGWDNFYNESEDCPAE